MKASVEVITPELAKEYLTHNIETNRRINKKRVSSYAKNIIAGAWQLNGEPICFNQNGQLVNGQHRLSAIIQANRSISIVVVRDIPNDVTIFDRGFVRATYSSLRMSGYGIETANTYTTALAKICIQTRNMSGSITYSLVSDNEVLDFLANNEDDVQFAYTLCAKNGKDSKGKRTSTRTASVMGAVFEAAQNGEDKDTIKSFIEVFRTGFYESKEQTAAIVLRNDFLSNSIVATGTPQRIKAMYCVEKAISDFCAGKPRRITYSNWEDPVYTKYFTFKKNEGKT